MNDIATATFTGNLTKDPELTYTNNGYALMNFSIANNQSKKDGDQWVEEAHFFDFVLFGKRAEKLATILTKGMKVCLDVKPGQDRWTDKQSGQGRSKVKFIVNQLVIMTAANSGPSGGQQYGGNERGQQGGGAGSGHPQGPQQQQNYGPPQPQQGQPPQGPNPNPPW